MLCSVLCNRYARATQRTQFIDAQRMVCCVAEPRANDRSRTQWMVRSVAEPRAKEGVLHMDMVSALVARLKRSYNEPSQ